MNDFDPWLILIGALPVLLAVVVHELAHCWAAWMLGDDTAKKAGRLTLDPRSHVDPVGTLLLPLLTLYFTPYIFGWAKPVPVMFSRLKPMRAGMALVALAGPFSNFLFLIFWIVIGHLSSQGFLLKMAEIGIVVNLILCAFNLLPIPPLDGSKVLASLLPDKMLQQFFNYERYGIILLLIMAFSGVLDVVIRPLFGVVQQSAALIYGVFL